MNDEPQTEPLPIWFFVGLLLALYGAVIMVGGILGGAHRTVFGEYRPELWWAGLMLAAGLVFLAIGLRRRNCPLRPPAPPDHN